MGCFSPKPPAAGSLGVIPSHPSSDGKRGRGAVVPVAKLAKELSPEQGRFQQQQFRAVLRSSSSPPLLEKAPGTAQKHEILTGKGTAHHTARFSTKGHPFHLGSAC